VLKILKSLRDEVQEPNDIDYMIEKFKKLTARSSDDRKEAAKIAVDASKTLIAIAVAVFVAMGGFIQFARNSGLEWSDRPIILFGVAAVFVLVSMMYGFVAIGSTYKRAEGREQEGGTPWSTRAIAPKLNWQSYIGLAALGVFALGILTWGLLPTSKAQLTLSISSATPALLLTAGPLTFEGAWTSLKISSPQGLRIDIPPAASGSISSFAVELK
jgi:hypothetical protein